MHSPTFHINYWGIFFLLHKWVKLSRRGISNYAEGFAYLPIGSFYLLDRHLRQWCRNFVSKHRAKIVHAAAEKVPMPWTLRSIKITILSCFRVRTDEPLSFATHWQLWLSELNCPPSLPYILYTESQASLSFAKVCFFVRAQSTTTWQHQLLLVACVIAIGCLYIYALRYELTP